MKNNMDVKKIEQMYGYLSKETISLNKADGAFVFCRNDPLLAERVSELFCDNLIDYTLFVGGLGKDSGYLIDLNIPEAKWQAGLLNMIYGVPKEKIYIETESKNGAENCEFGLEKLAKESIKKDDLIVVAHPTQLKRLYELLKFKGEEFPFAPSYQITKTNYDFDPENLIDQKEAVAEILRLADWPTKNWLNPQKDLPFDLVNYARNIKEF